MSSALTAGIFHQYLPKYLDKQPFELGDDLLERIFCSHTLFTGRVLKEVCHIPYAETVTYTQLAKRLGIPKSVRAIAGALGRNTLPVIVPCHRVVAQNGLGGYAFGLEVKSALLYFENGFITSEEIERILKNCQLLQALY